MLVAALPILKKARAGKYAVPAFNINNLEILKAVIEAATELKSPIIVQTSEGAIEYAGMDYLIAMVRVAAKAKIPVVLHLDHGKNLKTIKLAIDSGYTSVMFDGSSLPYRKNVQSTKQVVAWAKKKGVSVEAEIGVLAGIEDFVSVEARDAALTDPKQALAFSKETGCDSLAIAIGTAHGAYKFKGKTHLDIDRLKHIAALVKKPLVLHGASGVLEDVKAMAEHYGAKLGEARGVMDQDIKQAIKHGIAKINIDTDLRLAFTAGIREAVNDLPKVIDPRKLLEPSNLLIKEVAKRKIMIFGSKGKA
ncbi:MAG: class II fructose-1,6-bisphosphate aldolase [Candidatus Magasanikbacteria bacterium]|nr:class II fructose-1,6-bisphosphate aldolase [Candidatus Magasanikbacteria bacterium]MCA9391530.1 class II fructose-1,6-bisphosphate aldolase [Candidatus Magasanikbacteria bacterium]USN52535.1 MAG: class II fructose-1,6-bisphosphate aldolase [Candidatus Nomurabacteria bacterium]